MGKLDWISRMSANTAAIGLELAAQVVRELLLAQVGRSQDVAGGL